MLLRDIKSGYWMWDGQRWGWISLIKQGCCTPQWNACCVDDNDILFYFHEEYEVEELPAYKVHSHNKDLFNYRVDYPVIIIDDSLPLWKNTLVPVLEDRFIEYENTDTWALFFGLAVPGKEPYYEKFTK